VRITKPFYLGIYEVTQADYQRVTGANPSQLKDPSGAAPVGSVSWDDAQGFCARLSGLPEEQQAGRRYRLPTEAEWEYACRAGSTSRYGFGEAEADLGAYAWYQGNSDGKPHPVGQKKPNAWGLHDMYGNVWEWCADWYGDGYYAASPTDDPAGPGTGSLRVLRGGCWQNGASGCRPSCRCRIDPGNRYGYQGFRLAMTVSSPKPKDPPPPLAVAPFSKSEAKQHQRRWADFLGVPVLQRNSIDMQLTLIPAGEFLMGSPDSDGAESAMEIPQHPVRITKPFYLGVHEVTQAEYQRVMGTKPSQFKDPRGAAPVESVSWEDAHGFCAKLSGLPEEQQAGRQYRLPTEAEWEYACRAGSRFRYGFGEAEADLDAWYTRNSGRRTHPVGKTKPNAWGLYDMHGNVWEWCADWYADGYFATSPTDDPAGPASGSYRVTRGGGWRNDASLCRASSRFRYEPGFRNENLGFRLARTVSLP
jgi:formylglycine-generating enzyme required for sulfatase activity